MNEFKQEYEKINTDSFQQDLYKGTKVADYKKALNPYFTFQTANNRTKKEDVINSKDELIRLRISAVELALDFAIERRDCTLRGTYTPVYAEFIPEELKNSNIAFNPSNVQNAKSLFNVIQHWKK
jgi:hypothetical protein